jgi:hypothetical protein
VVDNRAGSVGQAIEIPVMEHHRLAIAGALHIAFNPSPRSMASAKAASEFSGTPARCRPRWA